MRDDRTRSGPHHLLLRFSYPSQKSARINVIGRQARGRDFCGENQGVFFCSARKSRKCVGGSVGGNSMRFQKKVQNSPRRSNL